MNICNKYLVILIKINKIKKYKNKFENILFILFFYLID